MRFILLMAAMFALPFIVWHLWRIARMPGDDQDQPTPFGLLALIGAGLAVAAVFALVLSGEDQSRDEEYDPLRGIDGQIELAPLVPFADRSLLSAVSGNG